MAGLNNGHMFLIVLEAEKSKSKMLADPFPGEGSLPGWQKAAFLQGPHMVARGRGRQLERETERVGVGNQVVWCLLF